MVRERVCERPTRNFGHCLIPALARWLDLEFPFLQLLLRLVRSARER